MSVQELNAKGLEALLDKTGITFVDFWAPWCAPCKSFAKTFEKVAAENSDISFVKVNIEVESELAEIFQIRSVPHLLVLKEGVVIFSDSGSLTQSSLNELVEQSKKADVSESEVS